MNQKDTPKTLNWSRTEYAIIGQRGKRQVWFAGQYARTRANKSPWTVDDGWAFVRGEMKEVQKELKVALTMPETKKIKNIRIVKLVTKSTQTSEILPKQYQ
jgi:hypothetical protein